MKKLLKGFTLVEILIVIVIIGILIGALVPRMQSAQGRARDVARKNDLAQLQSAILVSFQDKGVYPCQNDSTSTNPQGCTATTSASNGLNISDISNLLLAAGMNSIPGDPLKGNTVSGMGDSAQAGQYRYMLVQSNSIPNGGFVLMANSEVEGGSNWVVCEGTQGEEKEYKCDGENEGHCTCLEGQASCKVTEGGQVAQGGITSSTDTKSLVLCTNLTQSGSCSNDGAGNCTYENETQLRYILAY